MNYLKLKKRSLIFGSLLTVSLVVTTSCNKDEDASVEDFQQTHHDQNGIPKEYIVVFKDATIKSKAITKESLPILEKYGITEAQIAKEYTTIFKGVFLEGISKEIANRLKNDPAIESVTQNIPFEFNPTFVSNTTVSTSDHQKMTTFNDLIKPDGEIIPWGALRSGYGFGTGKKIWIIDTGIADIDEFNIDKVNSRNFAPDALLMNGSIDPTAWKDTSFNSHGTAVASIIAAKEDGKGIRGIAAGATVVAIRANGGGSELRHVAAAFDYVASKIQPGEVWNFSGGPDDPLANLIAGGFKDQVDLFENAIKALAQKAPGFVAAGNSGRNLDIQPYIESHFSTSTDQLYIIGAIDNTDMVWAASMHGNVIDYWAPGVNLPLLDKNGNVFRESGTSMAAPIVAGLYLLSSENLKKTYKSITKGRHTRPIAQIVE
ncbi:S8 family peptidase [Aquimarina aquimarini]|uniref:S8 family peptidase n=1 Tax=Aquimarina aquimarini TaxID=1191734 RepID=UPI001F1A702B|nr:S8/S53 family peptidase [Aquimarina aquimarini]